MLRYKKICCTTGKKKVGWKLLRLLLNWQNFTVKLCGKLTLNYYSWLFCYIFLLSAIIDNTHNYYPPLFVTYFLAWDFLLPRTVSSETVVRFQQFAGSKATGDELDGMLHLVRTVRTFSLWLCGAQCVGILFTHSFHFMYQTTLILLHFLSHLLENLLTILHFSLSQHEKPFTLFFVCVGIFPSLSHSLFCFSLLFPFNKNNFLGVSFAFIIFPRFFFSFLSFFIFPKIFLLSLQRRKTEENKFPDCKLISKFFWAKFQVFRNYVSIVCEVIEKTGLKDLDKTKTKININFMLEIFKK